MADKSDDLFQIDIVRDALQIGHSYMADECSRAYFWLSRYFCRGPKAQVESPAEAVFAVCFTAHQMFTQTFWLLTQPWAEVNGRRYRFDFQIDVASRHERFGPLPLVVEIDGHAFHEKTKEQVAYRNQRDRDLQSAGFKVFHFSYSELIANPMDCVIAVVEEADKMRGNLLKVGAK